MNTHTASPARRQRALTASVALILLAPLVSLLGCAETPATAGAPSGASGQVTLSEEARQTCTEVFSRTVTPSPTHLLVVDDRTASTARTALPDELRSAITDASMADGSLTVVAVDGEGAAPSIVAKDVALSTTGDRKRPSVADLAEVMPMCVDQVLLADAVPTAPGTDLHRALSLASELVTDTTRVFLVSDFVSTVGPFALDDELVSLDAGTAVERIAASAPIDFGGAPLTVPGGVGNTSTPLLTAHRDWLRALAIGLCTAWNATGCDDIATDPVNAVPSGDALPEDRIPAFPSVTAEGSGDDCLFEAPASITFAGDAADLRPDAADVFGAAIGLLKSHPAASATIVGHTASSPRYSAEELVDLATRRADSVTALFVSEGIDTARLKSVGVGDTDPKVEDIDPSSGLQIEAAAAIERRVDVVIQGAPCPA